MKTSDETVNIQIQSVLNGLFDISYPYQTKQRTINEILGNINKSKNLKAVYARFIIQVFTKNDFDLISIDKMQVLTLIVDLFSKVLNKKTIYRKEYQEILNKIKNSDRSNDVQVCILDAATCAIESYFYTPTLAENFIQTAGTAYAKAFVEKLDQPKSKKNQFMHLKLHSAKQDFLISMRRDLVRFLS